MRSPGALAGAFFSDLYFYYRELQITNPPTFKENYSLCYMLDGEISTDLGA
jgi:hypothetical protein